ncbi:MAG: hypothetical protein KDA61_14880, partial [Planctomycetales bacterium]|nr:hypothetical protein [Planctomycetales bacterium]
SVELTPGVPAWAPLSLLATFLIYGGNRAWHQRQYAGSLEIDELDSDDDQWLSPEWIDDAHAAVLVEQIQAKQEETLDRKRREHEDLEDAEVDVILCRLQQISFEELSEEEQAILKRASRRYRRRLSENRE